MKNLKFIFSRAGPFYHTMEAFIPATIKKAMSCLAIGGKAVIQSKCQSLSGLSDLLGKNFRLKEITRPNDYGLWREAWYEIVRIA